MCEIAVVDATTVQRDNNADQFERARTIVSKIAQPIYRSNSDGLGMLAVSIGEDETFQYDVAKAETPLLFPEDDVDEVEPTRSFTEWLYAYADSAWRIVIHGRLGTAGGTGFEQTHPIRVIDDSVDAHYIVHNGVYRGATQDRARLKQDEDREFNTTVDSEVIAHKHAAIPDDLDDFEPIEQRSRLNHLQFADDKILVRNDKYHVSDEFTMTCRSNWTSGEYDTPSRESEVYLITPDKEVEKTTISPGPSLNTSSSRATTTYTGRSSVSSGWGQLSSQNTTHSTSGRSNTSTESDTDDGLVVSVPGNGKTPNSGVARYNETEYVASTAMVKLDTYEQYIRSSYGWGKLNGESVKLSIETDSDDVSDDYVRIFADTVQRDKAPLTNARIDVIPYEDGVEYEGTGTYTTDDWGHVVVPTPPTGKRIDAYLVVNPQVQTATERYTGAVDTAFEYLSGIGALHDRSRSEQQLLAQSNRSVLDVKLNNSDSDSDSSDDTAESTSESETQTNRSTDTARYQSMSTDISRGQANNVPYWTHRISDDSPDPQNQVTHCTFHNVDYNGVYCKDCLKRYKDREILDGHTQPSQLPVTHKDQRYLQ